MVLHNKRIVVIGGSAGIGFAVAQQAAEQGARVVIVSANAKRVTAAVATLGGEATGEVVDVNNPAQVTALFARIGAFDHLVYTAGDQLVVSPLAQLELAQAGAVWRTRYWGALAAIQAALPHVAHDGSITLTSGTVAHRPPPGFILGAGVCAAMEATTRVLAVELAPIRVNIVVPGFVETDLWASIPEADRQQMFAEAAAKLPVKHIAKPVEIAEAYLSFMRSTYTTGQALIVDGGAAVS